MLFGIANVVDKPQEAEQRAALAAKLGARVTRVCMYWRDIEPAAGEFRFEDTDKLVAACQKHGLAVQGQLAFPPPWAAVGPRDTDVLFPPRDLKAWKAFVFETVERYDADGRDAVSPYSGRTVADAPRLRAPVRCWMVWMGVNRPSHFRGTAADYARVLLAASEAIRAADPKARILVEFSAPLQRAAEQKRQGLAFALDELLEQDPRVARAFDVLGFAFGDADLVGVRPALAELKATLQKHKLNTPIWFNGFGQFFDAGRRPADALPKTEYIRQAYQLARRNGIRVFICGWLRSHSAAAARYDFGLLNQDGSRQTPDAAAVFAELSRRQHCPERGGRGPASTQPRSEELRERR